VRIAQALASARAEGLARLDADLLLLFAMGVPAHKLGTRRGWLLAHDDEALDSDEQKRFLEFVQRRHNGEPLAYIVGHKAFFGLDLIIDARVLVPRPDTETLVQLALDTLDGPEWSQPTEPIRVLDLGTGSGAIALALKHKRPDVIVHAVDASADALAVAQSNASRLAIGLLCFHGNWFDALAPDARYHCIVSNPPYVRQRDPHLAALQHEPIQALVAGADGLDDIRHLVAGAGSRLLQGGWLLLEHGFDQGQAVQAMMRASGFENCVARNDLGGHWRCTGGQWHGDDLERARLMAGDRPGK
jgi:release factor glutamine methyltransferase